MTSSSSAVPAVFSGFTADRNSPVPLYYQVSQYLEQAIASGEIPHGALFENEILLAEQLGLSRPTMRSAMQHLVEKGLVVRRRGVGTRVVQPKVRRPMELTSLYDDLARAGQRPTTSVLEIRSVEADAQIADGLACDVGTAALKVVRLRRAEGVPIAKMTNYLPERIGQLDADELQAHGLYELMRSRGIQLHTARQLVGARSATAAEARILEESRGAALLTMERVTYDDHGDVVEFGTHIYAASRYSFETHLLST